MTPPPAWSKSASALGLSNPLHHLPQSQQVRQLQEQIQQHRRLQQQQSQGGYGLGGQTIKKKHIQQGGNNNSNGHGKQDRASNAYQTSFGGGDGGGGGGGSGQGHQHINIQNTDGMNSDDDIEQDEDDDDDDDNKSEDRNSNSSQNQSNMQGFHHHRSLSHPQLTQGFAIPAGFTGFTPASPLSPSSPGSITSETNTMTASMLSPGILSSGSGYHHGGNNNNSIHGIESSLASLASLSVMSSTAASSSAMPMSLPGASRGRPALSPSHHNPNNMATTPTTSSFQPQSLPVIYQNQPSEFIGTSSAAQNPSFNAFSSALSQHFQRQQQQQMTSTAMSSSLPAHSNFGQFQQHNTQHPQHPQYQHEHHQQEQHQHQDQQQGQQRSRSKSLTIPAPRIIPPARVLPPRAPQTSAPRKYHGRQTRKMPTALPTPKESVDPTRRVAHIISEQKRREKINGGFEELKSVIPECAQNTDSKATILRKATDYILLLEEELRKYTDLYQLEAADPESSLEGHERER
ncbi:hypothetical protein BGZ67_002672 [Mortierella alpina]|nr:hypothetical protein BGZ67_002672 [Mortierella alpina]